jgi:uncharacterized membrane protein YkvA (DUF1232 family)
MKMIESWKGRARQLKAETYAVYLAYRDPRLPWYARLFAACVVGYAFSPIDLIPDPIPVLGYLDDLLIVPLGIALAIKMIPPEVMAECRQKAQEASRTPTNWVAAGIIIVIWLLLFVATFFFLWKLIV